MQQGLIKLAAVPTLTNFRDETRASTPEGHK